MAEPPAAGGGGADSEGFSPLRLAKAGRRAGRHAAIAESGSSSGQAEDGAASAQPRVSSTDSMRQRQQDSQAGAAAPQGDSSSRTFAPPQSQVANPDGFLTPASEQQQQPPRQQQQPPAAPPVKRVGFSLQGSADEADGAAAGQAGFTGVSRRKQEQLQREEQSQAKQRNKYDKRLVDALVDVPELEEEGKEDITRIVAHAPKAATPHIQAMSELELDQAWLPQGSQAGAAARSTDINLSLLTACLLPSAQVVEPPDAWDYGLLFSQLKAELHSGGAQGGASEAAAAATPSDGGGRQL